jgi:RNA polymerase sigma factor (sigma-70 family)
MERQEKIDAPAAPVTIRRGGTSSQGLGAGAMPTGQSSTILPPLRRAALRRDGGGLSDAQLLDYFVERHDEAAFEALVRRHGPMVLGVCRRVLGCAHDAEDAFQATLLVLARKAASVVPRELVGSWLHGVARRTALRARAGNRRRREHEKQVRAMARPGSEPDAARQELLALLDQEVGRLPALYRAAVVLCDLEGRGRKEAARQLGVPEGTLSSRLATARRLLAARLARRGLALSGAALATVLATEAAAVPPALVTSTVKAATAFAAGQAAGLISARVAALAGGVLKAMSMTKLTIATVVLLAAAVLGTGTGWLLHQALADKPAARAAGGGGKKENAEVRGVIKAVGAREGALTVQLGKEARGERVYRLARDARILLDDGTGDRLGFVEGKVADLAEGMPVILRLGEGDTVVRLLAEGPTVKGVLKSADAGKGTITAAVHVSKGEAEEKTFAVARGARLSLDGGKGKGASGRGKGLAGLPAGAIVVLKLSADGKAVGSIRAEGPTVTGVVKAVDAGKGAVTLTIKVKGEPEEDKSFTLAKEALVSIGDGKKKDTAARAGLADVPVGANVTLRLSLDQATVVAVHAEGASVPGTVSAVDAAKGTITLSQKGEGDKTYTAGKDVAVYIDGRGGKKLADVPVEAVAHVKLHVDQKTVSEVHAIGPTLHGSVSGNAGDGGITLATKEGATTYTVAEGAAILVEDKREGKLDELIDGTVARLRLSADRSEVLEIHAEGPSFRGAVKSIDADKGTITLTIGAKNGVGGEDKDFRLAKDTVVTESSGAPMKLADLKAETNVVLRLSLDQKAAARITVAGE